MQKTSEILLDSTAMRVVAFHLEPGQTIDKHVAPAHVVVSVRSGKGEVFAGQEWLSASAGDWFHVAPEAPHAFRATTQFELLAVIVPEVSAVTTASAATTVDEALRRFTGAAAVLNRFGIDTCCGGGDSLAVAAQRAGTDLGAVLRALETAAHA